LITLGTARSGREWNKVTGRRRKLHNWYRSPNFTGVIKSNTMGCRGHITRTGGWEIRRDSWMENLNTGDHLEDLSIDGRIIQPQNKGSYN
jgi:hypothetical protein